MIRRGFLTLGLAVQLGVSGPACAQEQPPAAAASGLLAREPETPPEMFSAAVTMLQLARPELARQYLATLLASNPDDATLFAIRDQHGTGTFVQMSRLEALQPESVTLLEMLNTAARNQLADPAFQDSLIRGLNGTLRERESALDTLRALGEQAPPLLIQRLQAGASPEEEVRLMEALLRLGPTAIPPLEAALSSSHPHLQTMAADLLGRLQAKSAVMPLSIAAFDPQSPPNLSETARRSLARIEFGDPARIQQVTGFRFAERLRERALQAFRQQLPVEADDDGLVSLWSWREAAGTVELSRISPSSAMLHRGEELARASVRFSPTDPMAEALLLGHLMWRDVQTAGWEQPVPVGPGTAHDLALTVSPALVEETLKLALESDNPAAALASLRVLGQTGSRGRLVAEKSPLVAALNAPEWRVQFAAAETLLQLDPAQPFPGAARVVEILARGLSGDPQSRSVVIDPNTDRGASIAGMISALGFTPGLARTGQDGFRIAAEQGDVELAVLHLNTIQWDLTQTLANLRADPRTRRIPIAVYGPPELRGITRPKLQPYELVTYIDDAGDPGLLREQLTPLLAARTVPEQTAEQRAAQIAAAAYWLRHIATSQRTGIFSLEPAEGALIQAANEPAVASDALMALGAIGKPAVQARLAEIALAPGLPAATRRTALVQLAFHLQRYGRMIDNATTRALVDGQQQEQTPELATPWSAVVGALQPAADSAAERMLAFPPPATPLP